MKISVLLPYKENFSENYAGAVSIFVRDTIQNSQFFKNHSYEDPIKALKLGYI